MGTKKHIKHLKNLQSYGKFKTVFIGLHLSSSCIEFSYNVIKRLCFMSQLNYIKTESCIEIHLC